MSLISRDEHTEDGPTFWLFSLFSRVHAVDITAVKRNMGKKAEFSPTGPANQFWKIAWEAIGNNTFTWVK
ncbi:MAG: hypothetical protein ACOYY3_04465 [Chloroflexota bacterium]